MTLLKYLTSLLLVWSLTAGPLTIYVKAEASQSDPDEPPEGLRIRLSQAAEQPEQFVARSEPPTQTLSEAETARLIHALPPLRVEDTDEQDFVFSDKSLPPPRTGRTKEAAFPASSTANVPEIKGSPLEVLHYSPEGDVPIAPHLSIIFSQPMVPISSVEETSKYVPLRLFPHPPGKWRWLGNRTLVFEPERRFPMATKYSVTVPRDTKSLTGNSLAEEKIWTFMTPPPSVTNHHPRQQTVVDGDPLIFLEFDQQIEAETVLKNVRLEAGRRALTTRLASNEEIEANELVKELVENAQPNKWVVFRALPSTSDSSMPLPLDSQIKVTIGPEIQSEEGPLPSTKEFSFSFRTYGPLKIVKSGCGYRLTGGCITLKPSDAERLTRLSLETKSFSC